MDLTNRFTVQHLITFRRFSLAGRHAGQHQRSVPADSVKLRCYKIGGILLG